MSLSEERTEQYEIFVSKVIDWTISATPMLAHEFQQHLAEGMSDKEIWKHLLDSVGMMPYLYKLIEEDIELAIAKHDIATDVDIFESTTTRGGSDAN
jgi:hypothetical protein